MSFISVWSVFSSSIWAVWACFFSASSASRLLGLPKMALDLVEQLLVVVRYFAQQDETLHNGGAEIGFRERGSPDSRGIDEWFRSCKARPDGSASGAWAIPRSFSERAMSFSISEMASSRLASRISAVVVLRGQFVETRPEACSIWHWPLSSSACFWVSVEPKAGESRGETRRNESIMKARRHGETHLQARRVCASGVRGVLIRVCILSKRCETLLQMRTLRPMSALLLSR